MGLLDLVLTLVIVGVVLYCINTFVPMEANIKKLLNVVVILILRGWLHSLNRIGT